MDQNKEQVIKEEANSTSFTRFIRVLPFVLFILFAGWPIYSFISHSSSTIVGIGGMINSFQAIMNDPIIEDLRDTMKEGRLDEAFDNLTQQGFTIVENEEEHWLHIYSKEKGYDLLYKGFSRIEDENLKSKIELTKNGKYFEIADTGYEERK